MEQEERDLFQLSGCHDIALNSIHWETRNVKTDLLKGDDKLHLSDELNDLAFYHHPVGGSVKKWR
jgi:hypothetical protein